MTLWILHLSTQYIAYIQKLMNWKLKISTQYFHTLQEEMFAVNLYHKEWQWIAKSVSNNIFNKMWLYLQSRGLAERGQEEEQENEQHLGYTLCLGYLATID